LEGVSVRDANTYSFVRNLGVSDATTNLDPVLIYDFDSELSSTSLPDDFPDNACIVYAYYDRIQNPAEIRSIRAFCKKNNLVLVAVGAPQMWISRYYPLSPFQVLKAISSAEFVVTDTFHGTIFSAKYAKNFAVILRENNSNKLSDLLRRLGIKEHLVENGRTLEEISLTEVNREIINQIISIEREHTTEYLTYHLSACK
jgi:polysaccharide pyruvyl transferase WcaK-like protein